MGFLKSRNEALDHHAGKGSPSASRLRLKEAGLEEGQGEASFVQRKQSVNHCRSREHSELEGGLLASGHGELMKKYPACPYPFISL